MVFAAAGGVATAQVGGAVHCQHTQRMKQTAMADLFNQGLGIPTAGSLENEFGKEKVSAFLQGAVVRLTFMPDGAYKTLAVKGGEVVSPQAR